MTLWLFMAALLVSLVSASGYTNDTVYLSTIELVGGSGESNSSSYSSLLIVEDLAGTSASESYYAFFGFYPAYGVGGEIANNSPYNATINSITNSSSAHQFDVVVSVDDNDGGTDIASAICYSSFGNCTQISNSTSGIRFTATYRFTSSIQGSTTFNFTFTDYGGLANNTTTTTNAYPYDNSSILLVFISPNPAYADTPTLTCGANFSTAFGDSENISNRSYAWFQNGTEMVGEVSQTLDNSTFSNGSIISCLINTSASNWPSSTASNTSANLTILPPAGLSAIITYPPTGSVYRGCSQLVIANTTSPIIPAANYSIVCRLYTWSVGDIYTLNQTKNSSGANATFNFTIPRDSETFFRVNCTVAANGFSNTTQTVSFQNIEHGPVYCAANGTPITTTIPPSSNIWIIFIIIAACIIVFYVVNKNISSRNSYKP